MHALIIGAGVAGLTCAAELLERGHRVTLMERSDALFADACSWYAGGMLAPWCESESAEPRVFELGLQAADWWARHVDCVVRNGTLVVAHPRDMADLRRFAALVPAHEAIDAEELGRLEPDLAGRFQRGLLFTEEAHLDPRRALAQLAERIRQRGGDLLPGVDGRPSGAGASVKADVRIDCRGFAARGELPELRGVRGEMALVRSSEFRLSRPVRLLHPRIPLYVVPREENIFMIGATMIESGERGRVSLRSTLDLLGAAFSLHPALGEAEVIELGADVRPAFADHLPRVLRRGDTVYVNGLYRHGFLLAPALAGLVARALTDSSSLPEIVYEGAAQW